MCARRGIKNTLENSVHTIVILVRNISVLFSGLVFSERADMSCRARPVELTTKQQSLQYDSGHSKYYVRSHDANKNGPALVQA
jgi:hypothetical protein